MLLGTYQISTTGSASILRKSLDLLHHPQAVRCLSPALWPRGIRPWVGHDLQVSSTCSNDLSYQSGTELRWEPSSQFWLD